MFDVILLAVAGVLQIVLTVYTVDLAVRDNRVRNAVTVGLIGLAAVVLTGWAAYDAYEAQEKLNGEIANIKKQLSGAKVGLYSVGLQPMVQEVIPQKDIVMAIVIAVAEGTAKSMRCNFGAYTLPGPHNAAQDKTAISRFREDVAKGEQGTGEDRIAGKGCFMDVKVQLSESEIRELMTANRSIHVMGHAEWQNESGADFHTDVCKWMEPPKGRVLSNPAWHDCSR